MIILASNSDNQVVIGTWGRWSNRTWITTRIRYMTYCVESSYVFNFDI